MAELAASVVGLVGLLGVATAICKTSRTLLKLSHDIKFAEGDIRRLDVGTTLFANQIEIVYNKLFPRLSNPNRLSTFDYLDERNVMGDLLTQSKFAQESIERLKPKIKSLKSSIDLMTKLKWAFFKKQEIRDIGPQMESVKSSLILIMLIVIMEEHICGVQTNDTRREIQDLKEQVRKQMKMIKKLQNLVQLESPLAVSSGTSQPPLTGHIDALLKLGKSLVKDEIVPAPDAGSEIRPIYRHSNRNQVWVSEQPLQHLRDATVSRNLRPPTSSRSRRAQNKQTEVRNSQLLNHMPTTTHDVPQALSVPLATGLAMVPVQNGITYIGNTHITGSSSESHNSNDSIIDSGLQVHPKYESEFIDVRPLQSNIPLPRPDSMLSSKGYISTLSGREPIEARVNENTMLSVISQAYAVHLGLELDLLDEDVNIWIHGPRRARRCKARATIRWSLEQIGPRSFPVQCFVCRDYPLNLVLGKSFLDKSEEYRRRWAGEDEV